ncbi:hypothetical protein cypCar_00037682, partial [Cyprinus carpio]
AVVICHGGRIGFFQGDIRLLSDDMKALQPTIFPVVPRLLNRMYDKIFSQANTPLKRWLLNFAAKRKGLEVKRGVIRCNSVWDKIFFHKIQVRDEQCWSLTARLLSDRSSRQAGRESGTKRSRHRRRSDNRRAVSRSTSWSEIRRAGQTNRQRSSERRTVSTTASGQRSDERSDNENGQTTDNGRQTDAARSDERSETRNGADNSQRSEYQRAVRDQTSGQSIDDTVRQSERSEIRQAVRQQRAVRQQTNGQTTTKQSEQQHVFRDQRRSKIRQASQRFRRTVSDNSDAVRDQTSGRDHKRSRRSDDTADTDETSRGTTENSGLGELLCQKEDGYRLGKANLRRGDDHRLEIKNRY